ncbi:DNA repair protein RecN [Flavilitoribacter nigricans]|uniref:DNA repair protein RecN n=1 Tax=Flavilitoribacter nigricans (strain ATCC 23147 / DSM 23189 / NBRC 102662 / NCIMB 1420 / SS-2) TaxID=1122177 RepID=A0A2D0NFJ8_FLAN2|nr:DNA repair protein RecN [Flavilitoribacter nigricans]PHN07265.1 DNA repair protein RecN [Flavilitoribacter nigricans DSM 23189 = NBRC 102662]
MINSLKIKNYAIIESLEIKFSEQLTIITGETGAGKSILLGALGLIMGERADTKVLYVSDQKCVVEGVFHVGKYGIREFFVRHELDYEEELVIRREITPSGKTRAFVNDTPVNLKILQELSSSLIDLHQQFDTLDLHQVSFQLRTLDALANNAPILKEYQQLYRKQQADLRQLESLQVRNSNASKEVEFIQFQLNEFNQADLQPDEEEGLEQELNRLSNAEEIKRTTGQAYQHLAESEQSVVDQLESVAGSLRSMAKADQRVGRLTERLDGVIAELQDLSAELDKIAEDTEYDPERIMEVQTRLDLIYRLQKKHTVASVQELLDIKRDLEGQLDDFEDLGTEIAGLEKRTVQQDQTLRELAARLSETRRKVAPGLESDVQDMLSQLSMPHARLQISIEDQEEVGPTGINEVHFLFAANKGGRLQLIKDVASGGELSRLTLAIKSLVASAIPLPTLIFDEIDIGISGDVSLRMGHILRRLSRQHQVVSITHSPQIASQADAHYFVYKKDTEERTLAKLRLLNNDERIRAIATMLSQSPPSDSALNNARELIAAADQL